MVSVSHHRRASDDRREIKIWVLDHKEDEAVLSAGSQVLSADRAIRFQCPQFGSARSFGRSGPSLASTRAPFRETRPCSRAFFTRAASNAAAEEAKQLGRDKRKLSGVRTCANSFQELHGRGSSQRGLSQVLTAIVVYCSMLLSE